MPEKITTEELDLRSNEVQEILSNPPSWIVRWGITLIFIITILILVLSFIIQYPDFVTAKVLVTTAQPTEKVISRYSGQLDKILIKNGDTVYANQKLAMIENTADFDDVYQLKSMLDTIRFRAQGFSFPIDQTTNFLLGDIETDYINFEKSYVDYYLLKDLEPYENKLMGGNESLEEIKIRLVNQIKQKKFLNREYRLKRKDFKRYKDLHKKGVISQQEYESKQLEFLQMQKNISAMAISISQMREAISSTNQTLKETTINQQKESTRFLKNLSQSYNTLKKSIRDWEHQYVLSSSIDGVVSFQEYWGVNQFVSMNDVVFSILPIDTSVLVGKLTIPAQNAGKVTIDQKVLIKLDNFSYQQYGMLIGKVSNISVSPDKNGNYVVYISIPEGTKTSYGHQLNFEQELLGNAEIITEDLSVAERLFYKFRDVFKYR